MLRAVKRMPRWLVPGAVLLCVPAVALATIESNGPLALSAGGFSESSAECSGAGKVVTGGGFQIKGDGVLGGSSITQPDTLTEWRSHVHASSFGDDGTWTAFAVCRVTNPDGTSIAFRTDPIENFGAHVTAPCDEGEKAVGGGYAVSPPLDPGDSGSTLNPGVSRRASGQRWLADGVSDVEADGSLSSYVVCMEGAKVEAVSKRVDLRDKTQAKATCPRGKPLASGGFEWFGAEGSVHASMPISLRTWKVALRVSPPVDRDGFLKVFAYCMKNPV